MSGPIKFNSTCTPCWTVYQSTYIWHNIVLHTVIRTFNLSVHDVSVTYPYIGHVTHSNVVDNSLNVYLFTPVTFITASSLRVTISSHITTLFFTCIHHFVSVCQRILIYSPLLRSHILRWGTQTLVSCSSEITVSGLRSSERSMQVDNGERTSADVKFHKCELLPSSVVPTCTGSDSTSLLSARHPQRQRERTLSPNQSPHSNHPHVQRGILATIARSAPVVPSRMRTEATTESSDVSMCCTSSTPCVYSCLPSTAPSLMGHYILLLLFYFGVSRDGTRDEVRMNTVHCASARALPCTLSCTSHVRIKSPTPRHPQNSTVGSLVLLHRAPCHRRWERAKGWSHHRVSSHPTPPFLVFISLREQCSDAPQYDARPCCPMYVYFSFLVTRPLILSSRLLPIPAHPSLLEQRYVPTLSHQQNSNKK